MTEEKEKDDTKSSTSRDPKSPQVAVFESQVERIRTTATWLIATFGALGAALIASLQIAGLSKVEGDDLGLAIFGFFLGIGGATAAIAAMGWVLASAPKEPSDENLASDDVIEAAEKQGPWIIGGFPSVGDLAEEWRTSSRERQDAYEEYAEAYLRRKQSQDPAKKDELEAAEKSAWHSHEAAAKRADLAMKSVYRLYHFSEVHEVRRRFELALKVLIGAVVVAAIGIAIFATNVSATDATDAATSTGAPAVTPQPVTGVLNLVDDAHEEYRTLFGDDCDLNAVPVLVLEVDASAYDVVSIEGEGCMSARVQVPREQGLVMGGPVELPDATMPEDEAATETDDTMRDPIGG